MKKFIPLLIMSVTSMASFASSELGKYSILKQEVLMPGFSARVCLLTIVGEDNKVLYDNITEKMNDRIFQDTPGIVIPSTSDFTACVESAKRALDDETFNDFGFQINKAYLVKARYIDFQIDEKIDITINH